MTDAHDHPEDAFARNLRRLQTEGLDAATEAAIALVRDPAAPSQAKSATINAIFRASGMFDHEGERDPNELRPEDMNADQLAAAVARAQRHLDAMGDD